MARYYQDISHFRAPYRAASIGADEPVDPVKAMLDKRPDGLYEFKPAVKKLVTENLKSYLLLNATADSTFLQPASPEQLAALKTPEGEKFYGPLLAYNWAQSNAAKGFHVIAPPSMAWPAPQNLWLKLVSVEDKASLADIARMGENAMSLPILIEGKSQAKQTAIATASVVGPLAIGVGVAAVAGIGILALGSKGGASRALAGGKLTPNGKL